MILRHSTKCWWLPTTSSPPQPSTTIKTTSEELRCSCHQYTATTEDFLSGNIGKDHCFSHPHELNYKQVGHSRILSYSYSKVVIFLLILLSIHILLSFNNRGLVTCLTQSQQHEEISNNLQVSTEGVVKQEFGQAYPVDIRTTPVYQFVHEYLWGYFFINWVFDDFYLQGKYILFNDECPPIDGDQFIPSIVREKHLSNMFCLRWNLKWLFVPSYFQNKNHFPVTVKLETTSMLNIDPYSVIAFNCSTIDGITRYDQLFTASDGPLGGPWSFSISIEDYIAQQDDFRIRIFAFGKSRFAWNETAILRYPQFISFGNGERILALNYESFPVQVNLTNYQSATVSKYTGGENISAVLDGYVVVESFECREENYWKSSDRRNVQFINDGLKYGNQQIDMYSMKCLYKFQSGKVVVDMESSTFLELRTGGYRVICGLPLSEPIALLSIIGKPINVVNCSGLRCNITPGSVSKLSTEELDIFLNYNPRFQLNGTIRFNSLDTSFYYNVPIQKTKQEPLSLGFLYRADFSGIHMKNPDDVIIPSRNTVTVRVVQKKTAPNQDPFSMRSFIWNEPNSQNQNFELVSKDEPILSETTFVMKVGSLLVEKKKSLVFLLAYYDNVNQKLGDTIYMKYPRDALFDITEHTSSVPTCKMNISFQNSEISFLEGSDIPYYSIQSSIPHNIHSLLPKYSILKSFLFESGNNLYGYKFYQQRTFTFSFEVNFREPMIFEQLRCAYLIGSEGHNQSIIFDSAIPVRDDYAKFYKLSCVDQIYSNSYHIMIVAPILKVNETIQEFGEYYPINPESIGVFKADQYPLDTISILFNPNIRTRGDYKISSLCKELKKYSYEEYYIPHTKMFPLSLLQVYEVDLGRVSIDTNDKFDRMMTFIYQKRTLEWNLDPFSYRFFIIDDEHEKRMKWFIGFDSPTNGPWAKKLDMSEPTYKRFTFAIFGYRGDYGVRGTYYSIHYYRTIYYGLKNGVSCKFTFTSHEFPLKTDSNKFALNIQQPNKIMGQLNIVILHHISLSRNFRSSIQVRREFVFDDYTVDSLGNAIRNDLKSLQCAYVEGENVKITNGSLTLNGSRYILECSDVINSEDYDWLVIVKPKTPVYLISMMVVVIVLAIVLILLICAVSTVGLRYCCLLRMRKYSNKKQVDSTGRMEETSLLYSIQAYFVGASLDNSLTNSISDKNYKSI